jgi:Flp pilus assembly protein TadD
VKGAKSEPAGESNVAVDETTLNEIKTTIRILEVRPDYAAAWQKLGFLYEVAGRVDLARVAYDEAEKLDVGF